MARKSNIPTDDERRATLTYIAKQPGTPGVRMPVEIAHPLMVLERAGCIRYSPHDGWHITRLGQHVARGAAA